MWLHIVLVVLWIAQSRARARAGLGLGLGPGVGQPTSIQVLARHQPGASQAPAKYQPSTSICHKLVANQLGKACLIRICREVLGVGMVFVETV